MTDDLSPTMTVTVHYAQTLDGRIATRTGHSQWISGEDSLRLAHQLRAEHDAVMVGRGTVQADNPRLTVRLVPGRSPTRVVVDSELCIPPDAHVLTDGAAPILIAATQRAPMERVEVVRRTGVEVLMVGEDARGRVDLRALLRHLATRDIRSVLIEGGRELITAALQERIVDRLIVCIAPKIIGCGVDAVGDLRIRTMGEALTFRRFSFTSLGEDMIFDGEPESARQERVVPASP